MSGSGAGVGAVCGPTDGGPPAVGVVGIGTLGLTAVHNALVAGSAVTALVRDGAEATRTAARHRTAVAASLEREVRRGALAAHRVNAVLGGLRITTDPAELAGAQVVIEAVPEDLPTKQQVISLVEQVVSETCVIASSTSSIPAAWLAVEARRPERVVVAHYVWPAHRMPLVEVAMHDATSQATRAQLAGLLLAQGKTVLRVADRPGFLLTRALLAYWDAALGLVAQGLGIDEVDRALEDFGMPLGPLRLLDAAGPATAAAVHARLAEAGGRPRPFVARLQAVVDQGLPGFYEHTAAGRTPLLASVGLLRRPTATSPTAQVAPGAHVVVERVVNALAREVAHAVEEGVVNGWAEAGRAIELAYGFPAHAGGLESWWWDRRGGREHALVSELG